ncbi:MAG: putative 7-carboxy-7-deazaguanine synthase QueE [Lachnospiraceae bacterium]|nr:putative 7-carboxy-7-deazaguanine synthase QueE [Lachnospiraceae bacterium]
MERYQVVESFLSINGEGKKAGQLAVFIRFAGCNLNCSYCDTTWANHPDAPFIWMTKEEIYQVICDFGVYNVTLTGGEPLRQEYMCDLLSYLIRDERLAIEIETNGSVDITPYIGISDRISMTLDYKLPGSGMESAMYLSNYEKVRTVDTVKFVSGSREDLIRAKEIMDQYGLVSRCSCYLSPVFGKIEPEEIVTFMKEEKLNGVNLQIQMHKVIWDPEMKGV